MADVMVEARISLPQFGLHNVGDIGPVDEELIKGHLGRGYAAVVKDSKAKSKPDPAPEVAAQP